MIRFVYAQMLPADVAVTFWTVIVYVNMHNQSLPCFHTTWT